MDCCCPLSTEARRRGNVGRRLTPIAGAWGPSEDAPWASVVTMPLLSGGASPRRTFTTPAPESSHSRCCSFSV